MITKILLCSLAFSSIVRLIDRTGLPTWLNENGPPAVYTLTRVHFQYFKYTEFYFFYDSFDIVWNHVSSAALLLVVQQHLSRPRFPWITPSLILPLKKKKLFLHLHHLFLRFNHKLPQLLSTLWWPTIVYERSAEFRSLYQPVMSANQHAYFQHWSAWIHFY